MGILITVHNDHAHIFVDIDEEDRHSLPERIKEAIEDYGAVDFDRETADKFFHATWDEFRDAVVELMKDGYTIKTYIEKENKND